MASSTSSIFSGSSRFSADFQSVINRAVAIASLPGDQLRRQKNTLGDESSAMTSLQSAFSSLQGAFDRLDSAVGSSRTTAAVTPGGIVSTSLDGAAEGVYSINISDLGSASSSLSKNTLATVADPSRDGISTASSLSLTVGTTTRTLNPASHSLNDLAAAINANSDLGVRATIVRFGTESAPSYRLSIQSTDVGTRAITLNDGSDLLDSISAGSPMKYQLNGATEDLTADSRTVTIAPGLKITAASTGQASITVSKSSTQISDALNSLVSTYNSAVAALDVQHGEKAGPLSGHSIVNQLGGALGSLLTYTSDPGSSMNLTDLGLSLDDKGKLSFNSSTFSSADPDALTSFLGRSSQSGFLQAAHSILGSVNGAAQGELDTLQSSMTGQDARIAAEDDRVSLLRDQLTAQMSAADSLIASLEQQVTFVTGLFQSQSQKNN